MSEPVNLAPYLHYILVQFTRLSAESGDLIAILANTSALLNMELSRVNWAGFYLMKKDGLVLGPFQGKPAVSFIPLGKGVCGTDRVRRGRSCARQFALISRLFAGGTFD